MDDTEHGLPGDPVAPLRLTLVPGGSMFTLTHADVLVGRHSNADVRLHLPDVSRRHCRFRFHDAHWHVYDLQSMNGVYVNEERVGQAEIHDADLIRIGGYTFAVQIGLGEGTPAPQTNTLLASESVAALINRLQHRKAS